MGAGVRLMGGGGGGSGGMKMSGSMAEERARSMTSRERSWEPYSWNSQRYSWRKE